MVVIMLNVGHPCVSERNMLSNFHLKIIVHHIKPVGYKISEHVTGMIHTYS